MPLLLLDSGGLGPAPLPPPVVDFGNFILSDGEREIEFVRDTEWGDGTYLVDFKPPIPIPENTYAEGADSEGRQRVRTRPQNPTGSGLIRIVGELPLYFWDHADNVQELFASAHKRKGTIRYTPPSGVEVTLDLQSIHIVEMPHDAARRNRIEMAFEFECLPYGRLESEAIVTAEEISGPIDSFEVVGVNGHFDAFAELTYGDDSTQSSDDVEVCLEQEGYDPDDPSPLLLSDTDLTISGFAGSDALLANAYSANIKRATLTGTPQAICSTGPQPHVDRKKIRVRVHASSDGAYVRLNYRVGDGRFRSTPWRLIPAGDSDGGAWFDIALDVIDIAQVPSGDHSWEGYIEAYATASGVVFDVDYITILPAEVYCHARSPVQIGTPTTFVAHDEFEQVVTAGSDPLAGLTLPSGGTWVGAGDSDDFAVEDTTHTAQRSVTNDSAGVGRFALGGAATPSDVFVQVDVGVSVALGETDTPSASRTRSGVLARYTSTSDHIRLELGIGPTTANFWIYDGVNIRAFRRYQRWPVAPGGGVFAAVDSLTLGLLVTDDNAFGFYSRDGGTTWTFVCAAVEITPTSGKVGIWDNCYSGGSSFRVYDNFRAWVPAVDHALFSGQSAKLTHNAFLRENAAGTRYGKLPIEGQYLRIPSSTRADCKSRLVVVRRRLDRDGGLPDPYAGLSDGGTVDLTVTPRVLLSGS